MIVYSYFEKGCQKKCLRQSQKVEFTGLQRNLKKWEITTPMVIFDDRPSSTVVNHLLRLHVNLCQIPYMTKHALIITRTLHQGCHYGPGVSLSYFHSNQENMKAKDLPSHSIHFRFPHFAYALVAHI